MSGGERSEPEEECVPVERPGGDDHYREGKFRLGKDLGGTALETELLL